MRLSRSTNASLDEFPPLTSGIPYRPQHTIQGSYISAAICTPDEESTGCGKKSGPLKFFAVFSATV